MLCIRPLNPSHVIPIAEASYRWTPDLAIRKDEAVFLEISRCGRLYSEGGLIARLRRFLKTLPNDLPRNNSLPNGNPVHWAFADDPAAALARTYLTSQSAEFEDLPVACLRYYWEPFTARDEVEQELKRLLPILKSLGIERLSGFMNLPSDALASRFGKTGAYLFHQIGNADRIPWPRFRPIDPIHAEVDLSTLEAAQGVEPLLFYLKNLTENALTRLRGRGHRASVITIHFTLEAYSTVKERARSMRFEFPIPQSATSQLLPIYRERISTELTAHPWGSPLQKIRVEVTDSVPGTSAQKNFFESREELEEAMGSLLSRLRERNGPESAFGARTVERFLPEKSWVSTEPSSLDRISGTQSDCALRVPLRPLRLFQEPAPLHRVGCYLMAIDRRWVIREWEAQEKLSGEWFETPFERTYYTVSTDQERLWIFRDASGGLFLHGVFE